MTLWTTSYGSPPKDCGVISVVERLTPHSWPSPEPWLKKTQVVSGGLYRLGYENAQWAGLKKDIFKDMFSHQSLGWRDKPDTLLGLMPFDQLHPLVDS